MLIDSHCHLDRLDLTAHNDKLENALLAAKEKEVQRFLCVCIDLDNFPAVLKIAEEYPEVYASVGIHPTEILAVEPTTEKLIQLANHPKIIAFGETGLDYYRDETQKENQQTRFRNHIQAAKHLNKPLIVHSRMARKDTIDILREEPVQGVLHCFTEDITMAEQAIELGFYISFSGIITFQNAKELQEVVKHIPLERMLIETDSPYLAPVPYRGKPNEPAYVYYVAHKIAELKNISFEEVAKTTTGNFKRLFKI